ncbi:MAG: carboxypeptidase-like regulatory domain-containing protein, partial [Candidatus Sulfopaludibacter sp.]|nr:carboxypeptidase-like regulatory domain-containing protein [Candidatus Sulfopaludibacter sp.]
MRLFLLLSGLCGCACLFAAQHNGTVRAADQFIPGATVTARQGGAKLVTYTDQDGRYQLDLTPGKWEIQIEMLGFRTLHAEVDGAEPTLRDWTLEVPRYGEPTQPAPAVKSGPASTETKPAPIPAATPTPAVAAPKPAAQQQAQTGRGQGRAGRGGPGQNGGRGGRNGQPGQPGFTSVDVTATEAGAQEIAAAGSEQMADLGAADPDDLTIGGSISGGLQQASDDQQRLNRQAGRGGPGGPGGPGGSAVMNASLADLGFSVPGGADGLGMGGFGAAGAAAGFGADTGGGFGPPGGGGRGGGGGGG